MLRHWRRAARRHSLRGGRVEDLLAASLELVRACVVAGQQRVVAVPFSGVGRRERVGFGGDSPQLGGDLRAALLRVGKRGGVPAGVSGPQPLKGLLSAFG